MRIYNTLSPLMLSSAPREPSMSMSLDVCGATVAELLDNGIIQTVHEPNCPFTKLSWYQTQDTKLGILRKSWQVFHDRSLLGRCFMDFVLPVLEYGSAVWCSAADTHLRLLDRVVSGASFLTGGVFECDLAYRHSVAVSCMLYKIRCNQMHDICGALPVPYVPVWVTRGAVIVHRFTYAPPRCRTCQYRRTYIPLSVSLWNDLSDPVFDGVGLTGFKSRANAFLLA